MPQGWAERWQERRARRAGIRGPRAWRRALLGWGSAVVVLAAALVFLFFYSAAFTVETVRVSGAEGEVAQSVERLANIPNGRPLARVSGAQVSKRVLGNELRVRSIEVKRSWPSTITYEVELREPALALRQNKAIWLADANGVAYDQVEKTPKGVPTISVSQDPQTIAPETVLGLGEIWSLRPKADELEGKLSGPKYHANGTVTMTIDQVTLKWGQPTEAEKKWKVVTALLGQDSIDPQGAIPQTIDVSTPDTPVVTGLPPAPQG
ncbi:cell division protein FtsQ/DivIB [Ornithinimicrobium humiphilum]|uniref:cell division protein FtsQ/DivIB n=1 Tax=Ornithinimicrobium humiphilum TaxID=125288 RepID=UPI0014795324|nr:FtsQ-type POTRA domain-containing protein [Ornithinimicrobium humiphilum]